MIVQGKLTLHPWQRYSKKLRQRILSFQYGGSFSENEAKERKVRFAMGREGSANEGNLIVFTWLVDPEDGIILDAAFLALGDSALIGAADAACELLMRKSYEQALRLSAEHIDKLLRDDPLESAFPEEAFSYLNLVLFALEEAALMCSDIPVRAVTPFSSEGVVPTPHPGWELLSLKERQELIEELLDAEIRPYIAMDEGGVKIQELTADGRLFIRYEGSCLSCFAATGSTLVAIQEILKIKLHPSLTVIPDASSLLDIPS
ncbi:MAG: hypothetical protein A2Y28_00765 [Chlamydiae bacterium GWC2_50_10]|nr:MAG: hypothetical protein A2Z85_02850 [Chlamydiae bacterium GWA2_50_15]OGN54185.1 MAG: hypothetical protein A2Y28_00765 [Chlamydiae bacterium GWC2_50_10]OGN59058.1 MAG: hypothetical protein A3D18_02115 [Chlamydiae bacterium RIFCSPHIGHO2_02_FULL_49_29]OGN69184.1 MAG: hypothetical protein A3I15_00980 [Chlamydiae bacterium RIFCSPLOWO2_02_FULL_49_12]OGN73395.1 MAG: hypothetical protein A3G30_02840 [Chlamydiae bacterium RIFCSPLOWO2_12_FULL_49_12]HAZ15470.1 [Fe-S]-binding protein [Parachlamydiale